MAMLLSDGSSRHDTLRHWRASSRRLDSAHRRLTIRYSLFPNFRPNSKDRHQLFISGSTIVSTNIRHLFHQSPDISSGADHHMNANIYRDNKNNNDQILLHSTAYLSPFLRNMSCHECFSGHKHSGDVQGTEAKLHGRDTYVSEPPMGTAVKGIVVIVPDAFGWKFVNNRILADHFAAQGYRTYIPEFMDGK